MVSINIRATTGADGVLRLDVPTGLPETEIEGRLVMSPVSGHPSRGVPATAGWPPGFFEQTAGRWAGSLERPDQGTPDPRDWPE